VLIVVSRNVGRRDLAFETASFVTKNAVSATYLVYGKEGRQVDGHPARKLTVRCASGSSGSLLEAQPATCCVSVFSPALGVTAESGMEKEYQLTGEPDSESCTRSFDGAVAQHLDKPTCGFVFKSEVSLGTGPLSRLLRSLSWNFSISAELRWVSLSSRRRIGSQPPLRLNPNGSFYAGDWLIVPDLNKVERNGNISHLEPKAMEVLVYLSREPGKVISKQELLGNIWRDTFVTDDVLKVCIWQLRRIFQDDCKNPQVIETIPKSGYRLLLSVHETNN
jgi:DNA-binding winged helix-turn-helix (wHTH) protein